MSIRVMFAPAGALHGARSLRGVPRARRHRHAARRAVWRRLADDRRMIRFKLWLLGLLVSIAMALEVPLQL